MTEMRRGVFGGDTVKARMSRAAIKTAAFACAQVIAFGGGAIASEKPEPSHSEVPTTRIVETSVIIEYPKGSRVDYTAEDVKNEMQKADEALTSSTSGAVSFEDAVDISYRSDLPQGDASPETDAVTPCYTPEQIKGIHAAHRFEHHLGDTAFTLLILNGVKSCGQYGALADWKENISTYNLFNSGVVVHEFGHSPLAGNNKHVARVDCIQKTADGTKDTDRVLPVAYSTADIGEKIAAGCGPLLTKDGKFNAYSANESVMGEKRNLVGEQAFMPAELARIAPERFTIDTVGAHSGRHYLGLEADQSIGVKLYLPDNHPLKKINPSIKSIVFGLRRDDDLRTGADSVNSQMSIQAVAQGDWQNYVLNTEMFVDLKDPNLCELSTLQVDSDVDFYDAPIIYSDTSMDTVVSIGRDPQEGNRPYVQMDSFAATAEKRSLLKQETDKRRTMIFGDQANTGSSALLPILR